MSPGRPDDAAEGLIEEVLRRGQPATPPADDDTVLLTFVFADIRGYTKFTQERGDEAAEKLTAKFAMIVRDVVMHSGGTVFEVRGDEALCVFTSPRQSLRLAVALQQRFVEETVEDPVLAMTVGIGIDAGEAVRGPDGYRGGALNLAARLCARAKAGEVLASPAVTHLARAVDGLRYVVLDRVSLKGLDEPVRPVQVLPVTEDPAQQLTALIAAATVRAGPGSAVAWLPGPLARRPRATLVGTAVLAAAVATTVVVVLNSDDTTPALTRLSENSLGIVDPHSGHLVGQVRVGADPVAVAAGFRSVWTANADGDSVSRVDTKTHQVQTIGVGAAPSAIAVDAHSVWVANSNAGTVTRIDPNTNTTQTVPVGNSPAGIAVGHGSVWVTNSRDGTVSRIDPSLNKVVESIDVAGDTPRGIAVAGDVWVADAQSNSVSKINGAGRTHSVLASIKVGRSPLGVAVAGDSVWVTNTLDGNVSRIPTTGTSVADTVQVGSEPAQLGAVAGHVWIAVQAARSIAEVGSDSSRVDRSVLVGPVPGGLTPAAGKLWVTTGSDPLQHRGGRLRILGNDPFSVDPTYLDSDAQGALLSSSYDGLVGFRHAAGVDGEVLVPDLATALPDPTNDGRTYIFQLRSGIRWSTGRPLTVFDVRRGIERAIAWPNTGLAPQIVGGKDCRPERCHVTGITVDAAARTVRIDLVRPNGRFLNDVTAAVTVPADTPIGRKPSRIVAATGPYRVASYQPHELVVLTRNPYFHQWSATAQPAGFPDRIEWHATPGATPTKQAARAAADVESGRSDWADVRFATEPGAMQVRFGTRLHVTPTLTMHGLFLNTRMPPFDDVRVRQALAYAIDRASIARRWPIPGFVTCQFLPPGYPGYRPYCPYTLNAGPGQDWTSPDAPKAESLLKGAKPQGGTITIYAYVEGDVMAFASIVTALRDLGYHARVVLYSGKQDYFDYVSDSRHKIQAAFFGWVLGSVSPGQYLDSWGCDTVALGPGVNPSGFCDPAIDGLRRRAEQASSPATASALWAELDRRLVDAAPWIPLVHPQWVDVVSTRVHNYKRSPVIGVLYDQMWIR